MVLYPYDSLTHRGLCVFNTLRTLIFGWNLGKLNSENEKKDILPYTFCLFIIFASLSICIFCSILIGFSSIFQSCSTVYEFSSILSPGWDIPYIDTSLIGPHWSLTGLREEDFFVYWLPNSSSSVIINHEIVQLGVIQ